MQPDQPTGDLIKVDRVVEALVDGTWWPAELTHWRRTTTGRWQGWVRYTTAPGMTYIDWLDQDQLRPIEDD